MVARRGDVLLRPKQHPNLPATRQTDIADLVGNALECRLNLSTHQQRDEAKLAAGWRFHRTTKVADAC